MSTTPSLTQSAVRTGGRLVLGLAMTYIILRGAQEVVKWFVHLMGWEDSLNHPAKSAQETREGWVKLLRKMAAMVVDPEWKKDDEAWPTDLRQNVQQWLKVSAAFLASFPPAITIQLDAGEEALKPSAAEVTAAFDHLGGMLKLLDALRLDAKEALEHSTPQPAPTN